MQTQAPASLLDWQDHARCVNRDPRLWDGIRVGPSKFARLDFSAAKKICDECPVSSICLALAVESGDTGCMRGGATPEELEDLVKFEAELQKLRDRVGA